jgi:3-deoxy-D-manno-octulosonate 8-phosphate phosphatase (KDO 8-P phosphatase)
MAQKITSRARLIAKAKKIRLVAMDVDGVLTGGEIIVLESGEEIKIWNAKDRLALALIRDLKVPLMIAWITGRRSKTVAWSAKDLGVEHVVQAAKNKKNDLTKILKARQLRFDQAAFIGDDLIDLSAMKSVGFSACPADAVADVASQADFVSSKDGGKGCVRDVLEFILRAQNKWTPLVKKILSSSH